jgi:hypothetical protein
MDRFLRGAYIPSAYPLPAMPDLNPVFQSLRALLVPYAGALVTVHDDDTQFYLDTHHVQKNKKPLFFAAAQVKKASVSYHLMPVYVQPDLLDDVSPALTACMQGKSCFTFKVPDPDLLQELERLTARAYQSYQAQGFI